MAVLLSHDEHPDNLDDARAAEVAALLGARGVIPAHMDSLAHLTEGRDELVSAFAAAGLTDRLQLD